VRSLLVLVQLRQQSGKREETLARSRANDTSLPIKSISDLIA